MKIVGSTRQGRFSEKPAQWILPELRKRKDVEARLLDLRDFPMPFFDQPMPPAMPGRPVCEHDAVKNWTAQIAASDRFVFVTPEYNYGPSAALKNAIDWVLPGAESQSCRLCELRQRHGRPSRPAASRDRHRASGGPGSIVRAHPLATLWAHFQGGDVEKGLVELGKQAAS